MPVYKDIVFSEHCKERQKQRDITHSQKITAIKKPDGEMPTKRTDRKKIWRKFDGSRLVVILREVKNGEKAIIITSYWN